MLLHINSGQTVKNFRFYHIQRGFSDFGQIEFSADAFAV